MFCLANQQHALLKPHMWFCRKYAKPVVTDTRVLVVASREHLTRIGSLTAALALLVRVCRIVLWSLHGAQRSLLCPIKHTSTVTHSQISSSCQEPEVDSADHSPVSLHNPTLGIELSKESRASLASTASLGGPILPWTSLKRASLLVSYDMKRKRIMLEPECLFWK